MFDQVHGRELPSMESWTARQIDEAIKCKVQFGVLVLGQGTVTGRLIHATPSAKMALVRIMYDPREKMVGVDYPAEMRFISEIRAPANNFSLMRPANLEANGTTTRQAARRLLARAKTQGLQRPEPKRIIRVGA